MEQSNTPKQDQWANAIWRTAEIRMKLDDIVTRLNAMPPFARRFALEAMITDVTKVIKDEDPEFQKVIIKLFRDLGSKQ